MVLEYLYLVPPRRQSFLKEYIFLKFTNILIVHGTESVESWALSYVWNLS